MQFYDFTRGMPDLGQVFDPNEIMRAKVNRMRMNALAADETVQNFISTAAQPYQPPPQQAPSMPPPQPVQQETAPLQPQVSPASPRQGQDEDVPPSIAISQIQQAASQGAVPKADADVAINAIRRMPPTQLVNVRELLGGVGKVPRVPVAQQQMQAGIIPQQPTQPPQMPSRQAQPAPAFNMPSFNPRSALGKYIPDEMFDRMREKYRGNPEVVRRLNDAQYAQQQALQQATDKHYGDVTKQIQDSLSGFKASGDDDSFNAVTKGLRKNEQYMNWLQRNNPMGYYVMANGLSMGKDGASVVPLYVNSQNVDSIISKYGSEAEKILRPMQESGAIDEGVHLLMTVGKSGGAVSFKPNDKADTREFQMMIESLRQQNRIGLAEVRGQLADKRATGIGGRSFGVQQAPGVSRDAQGRYFEWGEDGQKVYLSSQEVQDRASQTKEEGAKARQRGGLTAAKMSAAYNQYTEAIPELEALSEKIRGKQILPSKLTSMNALNDWFASETSDPDVARFKTQLAFTADALSGAIGTGRGGKWTFDLAKELLNKNYDPVAFKRVLEGHRKELDVMRRSYQDFGKDRQPQAKVPQGARPTGKMDSRTGHEVYELQGKYFDAITGKELQ